MNISQAKIVIYGLKVSKILKIKVLKNRFAIYDIVLFAPI